MPRLTDPPLESTSQVIPKNFSTKILVQTHGKERPEFGKLGSSFHDNGTIGIGKGTPSVERLPFEQAVYEIWLRRVGLPAAALYPRSYQLPNHQGGCRYLQVQGGRNIGVEPHLSLNIIYSIQGHII